MDVVRPFAPDDVSQAVQMATRLLTQGGWCPEPDDPAGLGICVGQNGQPELRDRYDGVADRWLGDWRDGALKAVHRVCWPLAGKLQLECYGIELPAALKKFNVVEVNRLASLDAMAVLQLLRGEFEWLRTEGVDFVVTTTAFPAPRDLYVELGMQRTAVQFRYRKNDPKPVELLVAPLATAELTRLWEVTDRMAAREMRRNAA